MSEGFTILVADRNRHVGELLQRELQAEGYCVRVARDGREVLTLVNVESSPDLLILDLEIPYLGGLAILEQLRHKHPRLPVVIHTLLTEYETHPEISAAAAFLEKGGDTERLKAVVRAVLTKHYPERFGARPLNPQSAKTGP